MYVRSCSSHTLRKEHLNKMEHTYLPLLLAPVAVSFILLFVAILVAELCQSMLNMEYDGPITRSMMSKTNSPSIPMEELPDERQIHRRVYAALPRKVSGHDGAGWVCVILCVCSVNWATQNQSILRLMVNQLVLRGC